MDNQQSQATTQSPQTNIDVTTWELPDGAIARLGRGVIRDIAISPENRSFAVATHIGTWIYDLDSKQPIALLDTERGMVNKVALSNDGQWIATHNWDGIIKIHETDTCQCVAKIKGWYKGTSHLAFSPDNQYVVASGNEYGDLYLWCRNTGNYVNRFKVEGRVEGKLKEGEKFPTRYPFCLSPNGKLLAYISRRSTLSVQNLTKKDCFARIGPFRKTTRTGYVHDITFSPCSQFLAASIRDLNTRKNIEVQVWNIDQETLETTYTDFVGTRVRVAFTPDGTLQIADVYDDKAVIWNACQGEKIATLEYKTTPKAVCFSENGQLCSIITSREISVWDADSSITVIPIQEPSTPSNAMFFSQSDNVLVCKHWSESNIVFWDVSKRQRIHSPIEANSTGKMCALSPCEELLAIIGEDRQTLEIWNITSGSQIAELSEHQSYIPTLVFSPTGEHLISGDIDGKLVLWNVQRWEKQHSLMGQAKEIRTAVFHPNGKKFATADAAGYHLWDVESNKHLGSPTVNYTLPDASLYKGDIREIQRRFKMKSKMRWLRTVTFSPCGTLIAGGLWGEIRIWDAATLEPRIGMLLPESCYRVGVLVFSPCGRYLASGTWWGNGSDKTSIRIWEVATWENIHTFWGHPSDIQNLAFSKNGELLASSSYEGTILLWDMKPIIGS
ncbi:WD40 repeat domain-containing protein [Candidatus Poribacteria bacterium]|nr:WD40 repeat domain-containing protein [Candidatus Poribacteria bacterium]